MPRKPTLPGYVRHAASGQAVVYVSDGPGRRRAVYLGPYDSPTSHEAYRRVIAEIAAGGGPGRRRAGYTAGELVAAYLEHAAGWYVKDGRPTSQIERIRLALSRVATLYGETPAGEFGPRALQTVRHGMIRDGWTRGYINSSIGCVKRVWKWAVAEEMVAPATFEALRAVEGLRKGRCAARETAPVRPVPEADIEPVLQLVLPVVATMARLQLATGMRPGEVTQMLPGEIDRTGRVWVYRPQSHKTEHHGSDRTIFLGPRAQALLAPYMDRQAEAYLFSPLEAMTADLQARGRAVRFAAGRTPGTRYTTASYGKAIAAGCRRAGVTPWHPHQLRHNAATRLRAEFGPDTTRAILGQRSLQATQIYAELSEDKAAEAMGRAG